MTRQAKIAHWIDVMDEMRQNGWAVIGIGPATLRGVSAELIESKMQDTAFNTIKMIATQQGEAK